VLRGDTARDTTPKPCDSCCCKMDVFIDWSPSCVSIDPKFTFYFTTIIYP